MHHSLLIWACFCFLLVSCRDPKLFNSSVNAAQSEWLTRISQTLEELDVVLSEKTSIDDPSSVQGRMLDEKEHQAYERMVGKVAEMQRLLWEIDSGTNQSYFPPDESPQPMPLLSRPLPAKRELKETPRKYEMSDDLWDTSFLQVSSTRLLQTHSPSFNIATRSIQAKLIHVASGPMAVYIAGV